VNDAEQSTRSTNARSARFMIFALSGAVGGVVVAVFMLVFELAYFVYRSHLDANLIAPESLLWLALECLDRRFLTTPLSCAIFGALAGFFSKRLTQPLALAVLWASCLGAVGLALVVLLDGMWANVDQLKDAAILVGAYLFFGAIFGFSQGVSARLMFVGLERFRKPPVSMPALD